MKKLIWFNANVPKDSLMVAAIIKRLQRKGYNFLVTTREHESTSHLLEYLGVKPIVVGKYGGRTLKEKLIASLKRGLDLINILDDYPAPSWTIHFACPEVARVAYGLGYKNIVIEDTAHASIVHRLTLPLADFFITPKCNPKSLFVHMINPEKILQYNGVDPVEWITAFPPKSEVIKELNLDPSRPIVVLRPAETFAYYYLHITKGRSLLFEDRIIKYMLENTPEVQIVVLPRYEEQRNTLIKNFKDKIVIPKKFILAFNLIAFSTLLITGGGTMVQEGALLGIPSLYYFPKRIAYADYLEKKGFPVIHAPTYKEIKDWVSRILKDPDEYRVDTASMLKKLEKPSDKLLEIIE